MNRNYNATVTRDGRWWMIDIPELEALTQARRLDEAEQMARELAALETGTPLADVSVTLEILEAGSIPNVSERAAKVKMLRRQAERAAAAAAIATHDLAVELASAGVTFRDIGAILGVSHQRAAQLASEDVPRAVNEATDAPAPSNPDEDSFPIRGEDGFVVARIGGQGQFFPLAGPLPDATIRGLLNAGTARVDFTWGSQRVFVDLPEPVRARFADRLLHPMNAGMESRIELGAPLLKSKQQETINQSR